MTTRSPLALMEEVRVRVNDDETFFARVGVKENTINHWRRRRGIPEPKLQILRQWAEELADEQERADMGAVRLIQQGINTLTASTTRNAGTGARRKVR